MPRWCVGKRRAAAPMSTEKLPAPDPAAIRMPIVNTNPTPESISGVSAGPAAMMRMPAANARPGP